MKFKFQENFIAILPILLIWVVSMAAMTLQKQRWLAMTEIGWLAKPAWFIRWPFTAFTVHCCLGDMFGVATCASHQKKTPKQPLKGSGYRKARAHVFLQLLACIYQGDKSKNKITPLELPRKCKWLSTAHCVSAESNTGDQCGPFSASLSGLMPPTLPFFLPIHPLCIRMAPCGLQCFGGGILMSTAHIKPCSI